MSFSYIRFMKYIFYLSRVFYVNAGNRKLSYQRTRAISLKQLYEKVA